MTANLDNLNETNTRLILDIVRLGLDSGMDQTVINAAVNIANAESSFNPTAQAPNSTAWGPFQYLDGAWDTGWNRLVRDVNNGEFVLPEGFDITSVSAATTRDDPNWQILVAYNEFRIYYDGYPDIISSSWQDDVDWLVSQGYSPNTVFLEYAYLRHNTDTMGQVVTVYDRDFTETNVSRGDSLAEASRVLLSDASIHEDTINRIYMAEGSDFDVVIEFNQVPSEFLYAGEIAPDKAVYNSKTNKFEIVHTIPDHENPEGIITLTSHYIAFQGDIHRSDECFPAGTLITLSDGTTKVIEDVVVGDVVMSFGVDGVLRGAPVTQLLDNVTDTWLKLSNGTVVTPGHRFLRPDGSFMEIKDIIATDGQIVAEDNSIMTVTAEVIHYSTETAHLFEQHEKLISATSGATVLRKTNNDLIEELIVFNCSMGLGCMPKFTNASITNVTTP